MGGDDDNDGNNEQKKKQLKANRIPAMYYKPTLAKELRDK